MATFGVRHFLCRFPSQRSGEKAAFPTRSAPGGCPALGRRVAEVHRRRRGFAGRGPWFVRSARIQSGEGIAALQSVQRPCRWTRGANPSLSSLSFVIGQPTPPERLLGIFAVRRISDAPASPVPLLRGWMLCLGRSSVLFRSSLVAKLPFRDDHVEVATRIHRAAVGSV